MKYIFLSITIIVIVACFVYFGTTNKKTNFTSNDEVLRIHVRANSNEDIDQNVKYKVKDAVVDALIPLIVECKTKEEVENVMSENFEYINSVANSVLEDNGFLYKANCKLAYEQFPTRMYDDVVFEEGFYDAIIVDLGEAKGDNWWCVVYPPLCFLNSSENGIKYRSKIVELINNFKNK